MFLINVSMAGTVSIRVTLLVCPVSLHTSYAFLPGLGDFLVFMKPQFITVLLGKDQ